MDIDRFRRSDGLRGRVSVYREMNTYQIRRNSVLKDSLAQGNVGGEELIDAETGKEIFVLGFSPPTEDYVVK